MSDTSKAIDLAVRALVAHDRSRQKIEERLERAGVADDERREALATLERLGYLDDSRFAVARAESLAGRGYGDAWIRHDLEGEGVERDAIEAALSALLPEVERAAAIVVREGPGRRLAARLERKGFGAEAVEAAAGGAFADEDERA